MPEANLNPLSVAVLQQILESRGWTQNDLADKAGIHRATVSMHLSRQRAIRDEHLVAYLRPLESADRKRLLAAWLRDVIGGEVIGDVVDQGTNRINEEVVAWAPNLSDSDQKMIAWLSNEMMGDPDLAEMMRSICKRLGYC
jgi:transcriptional regulator with XRE-family HTH domain